MSNHHLEDIAAKNVKTGRRVQWFLHEFWPIMIFAALFVLMCAVPLTLSGMFANMRDFATSDMVWWMYGLLIIVAFLVALAIAFLAPRLLAWYTLVLGILGLVVAESFGALQVGFWIALVFLGFNLFAIFMLPIKHKKEEE